MDASLNRRLEEVEWGEYRVGDLFEKVNFVSLKYKTSELRKQPDGIFILPALTAGIDNQGLNNYVPIEGATILQNVISISANGANTGVTFFQSKKFTILQDAYAIDWKNNSRIFTRHSGVFIASVINSVLHGKYEWTNKANWTKVKEEYITLPTTNKDIDFDFMESFIAELEAERIAELSAYLKVSGLDNYELSVEELKALQNYDSMEWREYRIGSLFSRISTKKLPYKAKDLPTEVIAGYELPCLTSSFRNQGLNYYVPREGATILKDVISIPSNSDVYRAYFQSREFTVLSDAYAIKWIDEEKKISNYHYLFMVRAINKVTDLPIYSYKMKLGGWNVVKDKMILLPVVDDEVAFDFMEDYTRAISKLTIKDVVQYTDKRIEATKTIVAEHQKEESV
ncbi:restriction endonuclease subunit S [Streptococcus agalactiae]|nr:restriction endonuclease subunit S [Streptococcus agalactiae]KAF1214845.1 restriction endonuclease [Streptococcus agalactiae]